MTNKEISSKPTTKTSIVRARKSCLRGSRARISSRLPRPRGSTLRMRAVCSTTRSTCTNVLISKHFNPETDDLESYTIVSLLHDLCKAGFYKTELRNRKNDRGEWEKVPVYAVDDQFPYGHGEKSVFLIERFMRLRTEEAIAVRWHMGGFDESVKGGSFALAHAFEKYPLAVSCTFPIWKRPICTKAEENEHENQGIFHLDRSRGHVQYHRQTA